MTRAHLLSTDEPIALGTDQTASCGANVPKAAAMFMWQDMEASYDMMDAAVSCFRICKDCLKMPLDSMYLYGIVGGQDSLND